MLHMYHLLKHGGLGVAGFLLPWLWATSQCSTSQLLGETCKNVFGQVISAQSSPGAWPFVLGIAGFVIGRLLFGSWFGWGEE
jgi:hypothetical protein